ncbi:hypothetical protein H4P12_00685 [Paracoccus sp. 11-3]|uniref:Phytol kinase n=1 Tax=Paracoccus amoyensis TaxID=2760093 RepID=A0A926J4N9_9RHOB|nr:hypothetical protein [Paracoccus amoyensis]MBC9245257.1 hypothetical protein [Paracoccus amoyensis]
MNASLQIGFAIGSVAVLLGLMALIRHGASTYGLSAEVQRKLIHIATGLYALSWPWLFPDRWPAYMLVGITLIVLIVLRVSRIAKAGVGATLHSVDRRSYGDILLAVAVGLCLFLARDDLIFYVLPIAVLTLSDAAAALVGGAYGKRVFHVEDGVKSVEGCVTFFVVTLVIALICLLMMSTLPATRIITIALIVAGFGALVEAASWRGFDNLFLPIGILIVLADTMHSDLLRLFGLIVIFGLTLLAFRVLFARLGVGLHVSRVNVTMIFLLLAATSYQHAVTPILALAIHIWSRQTNPSEDRFPDLDMVAGLTLASIGWLVIGEAVGWNAILFYGMTSMAFAAGLASLALATAPVATRVAGLAVTVFALLAIRLWTVAISTDTSGWAGPMWGATVATLLLAILPTSLWPGAFRKDRILKLTFLSLLLPFVSYVYATELFGLLA